MYMQCYVLYIDICHVAHISPGCLCLMSDHSVLAHSMPQNSGQPLGAFPKLPALERNLSLPVGLMFSKLPVSTLY